MNFRGNAAKDLRNVLTALPPLNGCHERWFHVGYLCRCQSKQGLDKRVAGHGWSKDCAVRDAMVRQAQGACV